jgi:hypothetical protein
MIMLAPLATLAFLVTLWLVTLVVADLLNQGLGKVFAALKGQSVLVSEPSIRLIAVRISLRSRPQPLLRARPRLRAAA